jgi:hypothetical protein
LEIRQEEEARNAAIELQLAKDADKRAKEAAKKKKKNDPNDINSYTNTPSIKSIPPIEDGP